MAWHARQNFVIWINTGNHTPLEEKEAQNKVLKLKSNARITDR
jgi:hypothetical protein